MATAIASSVVLIAALAAAGAEQAPVPIFESPAELTAQGKIDELVFHRWEQLGIQPARLCSDAVFVRRAYLDVIGTLPTAAEAKEFLHDQAANKRRALIDRLLEREEFADYWALKWGDLLRVKAEFPINLWPHAAQAYHRWIHAAVQENRPYDRFVREMLTANGSNFRVPQVNFYRAMQNREPQGIAQAVALAFMGARAEKWPKERLAGMSAFFAQLSYKHTAEWKEEIVFYDPTRAAAPAAGGASQAALPAAVFPDGTPAELVADRDPRAVFADWLTAPQNPWFAKSIVNRVWSWLLGRGIINEPDDIRPDNPPANPELLAYLEGELVAAHYDLKHIYRLILTSSTYQLSSISRSDKPAAAAQFAKYPLRRLGAEVLIDALCQITGTTERYTSAIPEPFTYIPENQRSIALPDGSITSSFLEQFGRPSRDTGQEAERNNRPTADQRLHLLNSSHIRLKIEQGPKLQSLLKSGGTPAAMATDLYLTILSRFPTEDELKIIGITSAPPPPRKKGRARQPSLGPWGDLVWALINSSEFLCRH
jgi:hypothetical protein